MATHTGSEGTVHVGTDAIAEIRSFSLEATSEVIEDTAQIALDVGAEVTLKVYPEGATTGDKYYSGSAIVTGRTVTSSFDGMVEAAITVQGNGALTLATA